MQKSDIHFEIKNFLKNSQDFSIVHFVLMGGAVVTGEIIKNDDPDGDPEYLETTSITLQEATVYGFAGMTTTIGLLDLPFQNILAWGSGEVSSRKAD